MNIGTLKGNGGGKGIVWDWADIEKDIKIKWEFRKEGKAIKKEDRRDVLVVSKSSNAVWPQ